MKSNGSTSEPTQPLAQAHHVGVPASPQSLLRRIADTVLGTDPEQRRCIKTLLLTAMIYAVCIDLISYGSATKIFDARYIGGLTTCCVASTSSFYIIMRRGWNLRFAEPALAMPQTLAAQTYIAYAYAYTGVAHGGMLILLALVMVFGMFSMRARGARIVSVYTAALMGLVMLIKSSTDPLIYPAKVEWIYFVLVATVLPAISQLSAQLTQMRSRLEAQKADLERALTHIQEIATCDELTGLFNRRHMKDVFDEHVQRRARGGPTFYLSMIDLDHFKQINDTYGHAIGDDVLRAFSGLAGALLRKIDVIGRWGGEEFVLLIPATTPGQTTTCVSRLHASLAQLQVSSWEPKLRVTFSAGFTEYRQGEMIGQTIDRADKALYAAKAAGRNQTVVR